MQRFLAARAGVLATAAALLATTAASGAGFGIFEQGTKAMGMAGAFTAQADDPSALFHNVGGLAFQREREFMVGATVIMSTEAEFQGGAPFPGSSYSAEQETLFETPAHLYYVRPIGDTMTFGLGVNTPFGLTTEWQDKSQFAGRYISAMAALRTFDFNPSVAWQLGNFGIGIGGIVRLSDVELERFAGIVNPFTQRVSDVARIGLESDLEEGYGFNVGLLHRYNNSFSWGLSYRSQIDVDYEGGARFRQISTGNPQLDAAVAAQLPFGREVPIATGIAFPDVASFGVAIAINQNLALETDANWTGWSSFDELDLSFTDARDAALSEVIPQHWEDAYNYRLGIRYDSSPSSQWRLGYVFDESPQPDEAVGPLLPDADRNGFTIGYGHQGNRFTTDVAVMYLPFDERETRTNHDQFNGTYNTTAWLFGVSLGF